MPHTLQIVGGGVIGVYDWIRLSQINQARDNWAWFDICALGVFSISKVGERGLGYCSKPDKLFYPNKYAKNARHGK